MSDAPSSAAGKTSKSKGLRSVMRSADQLLKYDVDQASIDQALSELVDVGEALSEEQRQQLQEIARLMGNSDDGSALQQSLKRDGSFTLYPAEDEMFLLLDLDAPLAGGHTVQATEIVSWLKEREITRGVNLKQIEHAVAVAGTGEDVQGVTVVAGRPAVPAQPRRFEFFVRKELDESLMAVTENDLANPPPDGWLCLKGDRICSYQPPVPGVAGFNALGQDIEPEFVETNILGLGENLRCEGDEYFATCSGMINFDSQVLSVDPVMIIRQDVTAKHRRVEFDGSVLIKAAVRSGAEIVATGQVIVEGPVEAASIESTESDVHLKQGVAGHHRAFITAAGDVFARFAENAAIRAGRNIEFEVGSLHSRLVAGRAIRLLQGRGQLIGGSALAGDLICVRQLGAPSEARTEVVVGLDDETFKTVMELDEQVAILQMQRSKCVEALEQIKRMVGDPTDLVGKDRETYVSLCKSQLVFDIKLKKLGETRSELLDAAVSGHEASIQVERDLMPNVIARIGHAELRNDRSRRACRVILDPENETLKIVSLK